VDNELIINKNTINGQDLNNLLEIIYNYKLFEKNFTSISSNNSIATNTFTPRPVSHNKAKIYKHINYYFLIHPEEDLNDYRRYINVLKILNIQSINIFIKFLYYDKFKGVINSDDFYKDLKNYNSKLTFEELNDRDSLNVILLDDRKRINVEIFFNKDINNDIYVFSFEQNFNPDLINKIIKFRQLNKDIKRYIFNSVTMDNIILLSNSKYYQFSRLLVDSLIILEKLNKIFSLYDSIKTIDEIKLKVYLIN